MFINLQKCFPKINEKKINSLSCVGRFIRIIVFDYKKTIL
jgi:hypothetical protein